ncbi:MAG: hypothetical protein H6702_24590 [Myxococcales bacterium]|nr:hypothetical protein [Myxococcales bacterium]
MGRSAGPGPLRAPALVRQMLDEGGHAVETLADGQICLRTVIQLDGDVLTFVRPDKLTDAALHDRHFERVAAVLAELKLLGTGLSKVLRGLMWLGPVAEVALLTREAVGEGEFHWGQALWQGGYGMGPALLTAGGLATRLYLRRKLIRSFRAGMRRTVRDTVRGGVKAAARRFAARLKGG